MILGYSHLLTSTVDDLLDIYLANLHLYGSSELAKKEGSFSFYKEICAEIDWRYMSYVELAINVSDVKKFRQTILDHVQKYEDKNLGFGIDSNPILGKAIRLLFDQLHSINCKKVVSYRSIYEEWEPTCYQTN